MRSIPILAAALLAQSALAAPPGDSAGARWTLLASDEEGDHLIDPASIRSKGGLMRFRMRQLPRPSRPASFHAAFVAYQLDCAGQTLGAESFEAYDSAGRLVVSRTVPEDWLVRRAIYAGSTDEKIYRRVCPSSARARLRDRPPPPPPIMVIPTPVPPPYVIPVAPPPPPPPPPPLLRPEDRVERAVPLAPLATSFSADDYPVAALRAGEEGIVRYRLTIGRDGRVTACTITSSSGSASLDSTTCRLITARARFRPARTAKGKRTTDAMSGSILWRLPDEPAPPPPAPPAQP